MKEVFEAVHPKEVVDFFKKVGLLDDLNKGSLICCSCRDVISTENFRAVTKYNGKLLFSCVKELCFLNFVSCLEGRK